MTVQHPSPAGAGHSSGRTPLVRPRRRPRPAPVEPVEPVEPVQGAQESTGWLDLARVVAIGAVVLVHVLAPAVNGTFVEEGTSSWWLANALNAASRWCVPVFLMVSGALILDPRRVERPRDFYRKRMTRIGIPLVVWTVVYLAFRRWFLAEPVGLTDAGRDVLSGTPFLQLYFLFVLLGLYLIAPFLRIVLRHTTRRMQAGFAAVMLGLGVVDQAAATLAGVGGANAATRFLPFAGYFVAGWVLRDMALDRRIVRIAAAAFVASVVVTAALTGLTTVPSGWGAGGRYLYGFLSPPVIVMSVSALVLLRSLGQRLGTRHGGRLTALSGLTFGVFLVHPLVLYPLQSAWPLPPELVPFTAVMVVHWALTTAAALAITWVLLRIPYARATVS
ncbi:MAG TPA: acyltransferase family protein [Jiangellales bacterium]|nr:acyltransferase family protein [Jiangellales bacterium]